MQELFERIINWGQDKFPGLQYEPLPQIGFLLEKLHEVTKEFIKGDIDAAVGEITDIVVFSVNALILLKNGKDVIAQRFLYGDYPNHNYVSVIGILNYRIFKINDICIPPEKRFCAWHYKDLIDSCLNIIFMLGYSPELALLETVKKIESREGAFNSETGKFEKTATHYKPDYWLAKLK